MINLQETIRQLSRHAEAIRALALTFADGQTSWSPDAETWSPANVMDHLCNEERCDFRQHLKTMFGEAPQPQEWKPVADFHRALEGFTAEREASIAWLSALSAPDWGITTTLHFGPNDSITLSAGDMLVSWVEHDILHLRQLVELLNGANELQSAPYSVRYAGGW